MHKQPTVNTDDNKSWKNSLLCCVYQKLGQLTELPDAVFLLFCLSGHRESFMLNGIKIYIYFFIITQFMTLNNNHHNDKFTELFYNFENFI